MQSNLVEIPIRVRWNGWESSTYELKRAGWSLFANDKLVPERNTKRIHIAATDPSKQLIIIGEKDIPFTLLAGHDPWILAELMTKTGLDMCSYQVTDKVITHYVSFGTWEMWNNLQATDGFLNIPCSVVHNIYELSLFKNTDKSKELYIPQVNVDTCLNRILELQFKDRPNLIKADLAKVARPIIQAKIYSLAA